MVRITNVVQFVVDNFPTFCDVVVNMINAVASEGCWLSNYLLESTSLEHPGEIIL